MTLGFTDFIRTGFYFKSCNFSVLSKAIQKVTAQNN
jgi:hypothetical protein